MRIDLHLHTNCSDGVWSVGRLCEEIRTRALDLFCISDHDNLDAYPLPDDLRAKAVPGLEVDSHHDGHTVHILAYGIEDPDAPLLQALRTQREARRTRMTAMVAQLQSLGVEIELADVMAQAKGAASLGRPHLARALVARGHAADVQEAFDRYIADEGVGFVALDRQTSARTVELIHRSGGIAIIAHPKRLRAKQHLEELCELGVDGIEVVHPTADAMDELELRAFAERRSLLVTGGTDFHAPTGRPLGIEFPSDDVERLRIALAQRAANARS